MHGFLEKVSQFVRAFERWEGANAGSVFIHRVTFGLRSRRVTVHRSWVPVDEACALLPFVLCDPLASPLVKNTHARRYSTADEWNTMCG